MSHARTLIGMEETKRRLRWDRGFEIRVRETRGEVEMELLRRDCEDEDTQRHLWEEQYRNRTRVESEQSLEVVSIEVRDGSSKTESALRVLVVKVTNRFRSIRLLPKKEHDCV